MEWIYQGKQWNVELLSIVHLILGCFLYENFKKFNEYFSSLKAARMSGTRIIKFLKFFKWKSSLHELKDYIKLNNSITFLDMLISGINVQSLTLQIYHSIIRLEQYRMIIWLAL